MTEVGEELDLLDLLEVGKTLSISVFNHFQACVPYFEILEKWIYKGRINDPYSEVRQLYCFK